MLKKLGLSALAVGLLVACSSDSDDEVACDALPLPSGDSAEVRRGGVVSIDVLANDSNPGCGDLRIVDVGSPSHGNVAREDGRLVYMPSGDFIGVDTFTYTVANDAGEASATVTVDVFELVTLQGRVVVPELDVELTGERVEVRYPGAQTISVSLDEQGEYSLEVPVYDYEALGWAELRVSLSAPVEGSAASHGLSTQQSDPANAPKRMTLHTLLPSRGALIDAADRDMAVDVSALPALQVTPFSSAFSALIARQVDRALLNGNGGDSQPLFRAMENGFDHATLVQAAKAIGGETLMDFARLHLALLEWDSELVLPRPYDSFLQLALSSDSDALLAELFDELAADADRYARLTDSLLSDEGRLTIDTEALQGRHAEMPAQVSGLARGHGATVSFSSGSASGGGVSGAGVSGALSKSRPLQMPELASYVVNGADLETSAIWQRGQHLYSAAGSSWWHLVEDAGQGGEYLRLLHEQTLQTGTQGFELPGSYVLPAVAGRSMELVYEFHEDGTFTTSHSLEQTANDQGSVWFDVTAPVHGVWSLSEQARVLSLQFDDLDSAEASDSSGSVAQREVQVRWLAEGYRVVMQDTDNGALRFGPGMAVALDTTNDDWLAGFANRRLGSVHEMLDVANWRGSRLLRTPNHDITLNASGSGSYARDGENFTFQWQRVDQGDFEGALRMTMDSVVPPASSDYIGERFDGWDGGSYGSPLPEPGDALGEQRRYWLPLQSDGERLWVLEWSQTTDRRGQTQLFIRPRVNLYLRPGVDTLG